jgi:hypothetical protein
MMECVNYHPVMTRRLNTPLWSGLILALVGIFSYIFLFVRWPITRDFPWTSFVMFAIALVLLVIGFRRAERKLVPSIVLVIGIGLMAFFTFGTLVVTRMLPASHGAPAVGQKAPEFTLPDTNHQSVALSQLLAAPGSKGVVLIFYRGYW